MTNLTILNLYNKIKIKICYAYIYIYIYIYILAHTSCGPSYSLLIFAAFLKWMSTIDLV